MTEDTIDALTAEAHKLAPILRGLVEGGSGDPTEIYEPDYSPTDGDVYVSRAADLLEEFARALLFASKPAVAFDHHEVDHGTHIELVPHYAAPAAPAQSEPVASIGSEWRLLWIGSGPIAPIVKKHSLKIGDLLYAAPLPAQTERALTDDEQLAIKTLMTERACKAHPWAAAQLHSLLAAAQPPTGVK